ncbi:unnamed protein product [Larinioides sclopetarius]|uniref:Odorant receptor n=1 Tax=Larinioides sclopetarius TaxID=280406 RepID=A0AAV2A306_9ARAC
MGGYEVTADSEQPMMFRACLPAVKADQCVIVKMARLLIKEKVERKDPEESRVINALSEAVKTVRSNAISLSCFIAEFNGWRKKIEPNIAFLRESYESFLERTSPSALQRLFVTTFAATCFLESIRTKNPDCCFIGIFFCALLALMSFMTAIIGLLSTAPNKSVKSILNWISTMNVLSKEVSHRLDRARRVFQLTVGPEMLHTISRDTDCLTVSRWRYFFRLFFLNFLHWFSIYGPVFAVQVCIFLKIQSFMELSEVLKVFSLLIIFVNVLIQDIKIRRIRKQISFQARCLESETDAFLFWFHERSNLRLLLEQYEFLKEPLLRTLKCGNDINKKDSAQSFILFGITMIKVSDVLQDSIDPKNLKSILQFLIFNDTSMCSKTKVELISDKINDEEENELANLPIGIVSHSSLAQEVQNNEDKNKVSSTTDNKVSASQFAQKGMKEEGNSETSSPADDKVLHSPIAQKCVDERDNKPLSTSVERDLSEKNRIETLPFQNTEREDMKIALEYRTHETKSDSRTISDALDKNDADGKRPEISVILENMSEIETSFISYEEKESTNDPTLPSLSFRQTYDSKDSDLTEQSGKDENVGRMEYSKTNKGRASMNKSPLQDTPVKANLVINRKNFLSENPDLNHDAVVTEADETTKFRNLDETFHTTKVVSSSAVKTQPNSEVEDQEKIHFRKIKPQADNTKAATQESGCDKSLKSVHRDKTLVDYSITLSDIGMDLKSISEYLNCYHQSLEDKEINLDKTASEEVVREVLRNYFKHVNLPDSPIQMPTGIKDKSEDRVLRKDKNVQSHPQNASLEKGIEDNTTQAGVSVEEGDKADKEQKHSYFKKTKIKLKENGDLTRLKSISQYLNGCHQSLEDNEHNLDKTASEEIVPEVLRNYFKHVNLPDSPIQMPTGIKDKSEDTVLHKDKNVQSHPQKVSLVKGIEDNTTQAGASVEEGDKADKEKKHPHFKQAKLKLKENGDLKSECKQKKTKTFSRNNSVSEDPPANISDLRNNGETNDAKSTTSDYVLSSHISDLDQPSIENLKSLDPNPLNSVNLLMQSLSIDSQKQEPSDDPHSFIKRNEENIHLETDFNKGKEENSDNRSYTSVFRSPQFPSKDPQRTSNNNLEKNHFEGHSTPREAHREIDLSKEKAMILNDKSNVFVFGSLQFPSKDPPKNSNNNLEKNHFAGYNTPKEAHSEIDLSKEKAMILNDKSNVFVFGSLHFPSKDPQKTSNNNSEKNHFEGHSTPREAHSEIDLSKEKAMILNDKSNVFVFGSLQFPSKDPQKTSNNNLEKNHFEGYNTPKDAYNENDLSKEKAMILNDKSNVFVFGSLQFPSKDPQKTSNTNLEKNHFEGHSTPREAHSEIDLSKEKAMILNDKSNVFVFGSLQFPSKDPQKTSNTNLEKNHFEGHSTPREAHSEIDLSKEKAMILNDKSNVFLFGSLHFPSKDPPKNSNNNLEKNHFEGYYTPKEVHNENDLSKQKAMILNDKSNVFVFGSLQFPSKDPPKNSNNNLEKNHFEGYTNSKGAHGEILLSKEKEMILNDKSNVFVFGSLQFSSKNPPKNSNNNLEKNHFEGYNTPKEAHSEIELSKEEATILNDKSNVFVFGSLQFPSKDPQKTSNNNLEKNHFGGYNTPKETHSENDLSKEKAMILNDKSNVFVFGSLQFPSKDPKKTSNNNSEKNHFEGHSTPREAHSEIDLSKEKAMILNDKSNVFVFGSLQFPSKNPPKNSNNNLEKNHFEGYNTPKEAHSEIELSKEEATILNDKSNVFVFGSLQFPSKDPQKTSNNNLEKNHFEGYNTPKEAHSENDLSKEKAMILNDKSNVFVFGSLQFPSKDPQKTSNNNLEKNHFDGYTNSKEAHGEIHLSKEKEMILNDKSNVFVFGSLQFPSKDPQKTSNNNSEKNHFEGYDTPKEAHSENDLSKEKAMILNDKSNVFVFGSLQFPSKDPQKTSNNNLEKNHFEGYTTPKEAYSEIDLNKEKEKIFNNDSDVFVFGPRHFARKDPKKPSTNNLERSSFGNYTTGNVAHHGTALQELPSEDFEKCLIEENSKDKQKTANSEPKLFEFGSTKKDNANEKLSNNILQSNHFENSSNKSGVGCSNNVGFGDQGFPKESFNEQNMEQKSDTEYIEIPIDTKSRLQFQRSFKITLNASDKEIENEAESSMKKAIQRLAYGDFIYESTNVLNQINFNPALERGRHQEEKSANQNKSRNGKKNQISRSNEIKPCISQENGSCTMAENETPGGKQNEPSTAGEKGPCIVTENESPGGKQNEPSTAGEKGPCIVTENETPGGKQNEPSTAREKGPCIVTEKETPDGKPNELSTAREKGPCIVTENETPDGKPNEPSTAREKGPCIVTEKETPDGKPNEPSTAREKGPCIVTENETPDGKPNEPSTAGEKGPCIVTKNETPRGKQNEPSTAREKGPCNVTEKETPGGKQNEPSTAGEKGPCIVTENKTPGGKQNGLYTSEEKGPWIVAENITFDGKQNKLSSAEENGFIIDKGNQTSNNKENEFCSSEENAVKNATTDGKQNETLNIERNRPSIGTENENSGDKQNASLNSENIGPTSEEGSQISGNKENKSFQENKTCSGIQKGFPGGKQTKSFHSNENAPIGDQGSLTSSNEEKKSCNFGETGPCSEEQNVAADGKQNKYFKSNEYRPISNLGNQASSDKGDRSCSSEGNESVGRAVGNDISNNEIYKPHSFQENGPHSEVENESTDRKQNKSLKAEENVTSNGKDERNSLNKKSKQFNSKANQPDTPGESELYISKADEFHSSESNVQGSDENRPLSCEENKYCDAENNEFGNDEKDKTFDAEGKELCNDEMHEPCHDGENTIGERTLLDSTNNSTDLHVPKNMTEKRPRSSESSATSKLKKETSTESEVLVKNEKAMKDRLESQQNQEMQTHHAEIADTTPDAGSLNQSDKQNTKDDAGTDTITDSGYYDMDGNMSSLQKSKQNSNTCHSNEDELGKESNYNNFEESSHSFASDKNRVNTHLDHTLSDANLSDSPSSGNKESKNFRMEDNVVLPEYSGMDSNKKNPNTELNQSILASESQQDIEKCSINKKINIQYSEREIKCAETSTELKALKSAGSSASDCTELSSSELALLLASELSSSDHKDYTHLISADISMLSEDCKNSTHKDDETDINMGLLFEENQYNVEHRSSNEEVDGQNSGTVSERAACSSESPPAAELPAQLPSKVPTSEHAESPSSIQKECSDLQPGDASMLSENFRMNSTQIDESRDLNLSFSPDENNHSNNGEVSDQHSGTASEKADDSSECKSPKSGTVHKVSGKRVRKSHKLKDRRSSSIMHDTSDSDSRKQATWDSDICSKKAQERTVERPVHEASSSEFDGNEHHFNIEFVGDQCSGTTSKGAEYSSSSKLGIARLSKSENGAIISEQTQILSPEQSESFYTRDEAPVCSLRYKNLDVDIFPPLTRLKLKLVDQNRKTRTSSENNEALMSETSVCQSMNSEDSLASEDDGSTKQAESQTSIRQGSGVIQKYENKPLHFEDRNVTLNYSKHNGSLNHSHSLSEDNQITFKSKNTKLFIKTENIDQSEGNIS